MKLAKFIVPSEAGRNRGATGGIISKRKPLEIRQYTLPDYQFFPEKLHLLQKKELQLFQEKETTENLLTKEEREEKKRLYSQGFTSWTKREYLAYIKGCEKHGREQVEKIAEDIPEKSVEMIKEYGRVFWARISELQDAEKIQAQIQKGEHKNLRMKKIKEYLKEKIQKEGEALAIPYPINMKSFGYTEEADRFILLSLNGQLDRSKCYENLWSKIRRKTIFLFDHYLRLRSPNDLQKRAHFLFTLLLREKKFLEETEEALSPASPPKEIQAYASAAYASNVHLAHEQ